MLGKVVRLVIVAWDVNFDFKCGMDQIFSQQYFFSFLFSIGILFTNLVKIHIDIQLFIYRSKAMMQDQWTFKST